jgi:hypothetical protein
MALDIVSNVDYNFPQTTHSRATHMTTTDCIISQVKQFGKYRVIRGELIKRGMDVGVIARHFNVHPYSVRLVMMDRMKSSRIASYLESILGVPPGTLFPYVTQKPRRDKSSFRKSIV